MNQRYFSREEAQIETVMREKSSKKQVLFASGDSDKEKCFQSGFKNRDCSSTLYIVSQKIEKLTTATQAKYITTMKTVV